MDMKPDEAALAAELVDRGAYNRFARPVTRTVRDVIDNLACDYGYNPKRLRYVLQKWSDKGWYEYGVCVDLGWLTPEGVEALASPPASGARASGTPGPRQG